MLQNDTSLSGIIGLIILLGVVTMAILQLLKDLLRVRFWFQTVYVRSWLSERILKAQKRHEGWLKDPDREKKRARTSYDAAPFRRAEEAWLKDKENSPMSGPSGKLYNANQAYEQFLQLAGGDKSALFRLPHEQLCAQVNSAALVALDYPARYSALFAALLAKADTPDIAITLYPDPSIRETGGVQKSDKEGNVQNVELTAYLDARTRINHYLQSAIDGLQIKLGAWWKSGLQLASIVLAIVLAAWAVHLQASTDHVSSPGLRLIVAAGVFAGFLAPIARDLVAILEKLKK